MGARKQVLELVCTVYTWTNWHVYSDICVYFQRVSRVVACAPRDIYVSAVCRQTTGLYAHRMCLFVVYTQRNGCICGMYTDKCVYLCCLQVACMHVELCLTAVYTQSNVFAVCMQRTGFVSCQPGVQHWGSSCTTGRRRSDGSLDIPSCTVAETTSTSFSPRESCCEATAVSYFTVLVEMDQGLEADS